MMVRLSPDHHYKGKYLIFLFRLKCKSYKIVHMRTDAVTAVITAVDIVPDVRYAILCHNIVIALGGIENCLVVGTRCQQQQIGRFARELVIILCNQTGRYAGSRADCTYITEHIGKLMRNIQRFSAAHGEARDPLAGKGT